MELKPDENTHLFKAIRRSNRTFMELKLFTRVSILQSVPLVLIVPLWN